MVTEIGIVAGEIIHLLEESDRALTLMEVEVFIDRPIRLIDMSLGWLIRENYVRVIPICGEKFLVLSERDSRIVKYSQAEYECVN